MFCIPASQQSDFVRSHLQRLISCEIEITENLQGGAVASVKLAQLKLLWRVLKVLFWNKMSLAFYKEDRSEFHKVAV